MCSSFREGVRADDGDAIEIGLSGAGVRAVDRGAVVGVEVEADALCEEGEVSWKTETKNLRRLRARVFSGCLNNASPKFVGDRVCTETNEELKKSIRRSDQLEVLLLMMIYDKNQRSKL